MKEGIQAACGLIPAKPLMDFSGSLRPTLLLESFRPTGQFGTNLSPAFPRGSELLLGPANWNRIRITHTSFSFRAGFWPRNRRVPLERTVTSETVIDAHMNTSISINPFAVGSGGL